MEYAINVAVGFAIAVFVLAAGSIVKRVSGSKVKIWK